MDGIDKYHDKERVTLKNVSTWGKVNKGLQELLRTGVTSSISIVLGRHNISGISDFIEEVVSTYQINAVGINYLKPKNLNNNNYLEGLSPKVYAETIYKIHKNYRDSGLYIESLYRKLIAFVERKALLYDCGASGFKNLNLLPNGKIGPCKSFLQQDVISSNHLNEETLKVWVGRTQGKTLNVINVLRILFVVMVVPIMQKYIKVTI